MGRMVISPYYGAYSTKHGSKGVLMFAHGLIVLGALLYTQVWSLYSLFAAQIILGLGCGTLGVTRAYFAESVPRDQGFLLGIFGSAGSLARIVFPIVTGFVATHFSADAVFGVLATLLGTTLAILVVHRAAFREAIA